MDIGGEPGRRLHDFIARQQRRLLPRRRVLVEYRSQGRRYFIESVTRELSPADVLLVVNQQHVPGDAMELKLRLGRENFEFQARVIACDTTGERDGDPVHTAKASIIDPGDVVEAALRKAVRALEP